MFWLWQPNDMWKRFFFHEFTLIKKETTRCGSA